MLNVTPQLGTTVTCVKVTIHKVKVVMILITGSPFNVISSCLVVKIKIAPDLNHLVVYGTAALASTKSIDAYSALPLCFGKIFFTASALVLESKGYNLLIGNQFLMEFNGIFNH